MAFSDTHLGTGMETRPGDILLLHHKGQAVVYLRVEDISVDVKPGWWQIKLFFLQVPPHEVTWILREEYIDGGEFTMGGDTMRLQRLAPVAGLPPPQPPQPSTPEPAGAGAGGKVFSLASRRAKTS